MGSETTTAATGKVGVVRRDPMAMRPFCGYNMADYFSHWLGMGGRVANPPKIFMVNWFRKDEKGRFMWPGFRENSRVLKWMIDRIEGRSTGRETPLGVIPEYQEFELDGLDFDREGFERLFTLDPADWEKEVQEVESFYKDFGERLPGELKKQLESLKQGLRG